MPTRFKGAREFSQPIPVAWIQPDWLVIFREQVVLAIPVGSCWERIEHAVHIE